jgi:hypothetical protein
MFYAVGMHGHIIFRTNRKEDWIIWGTAGFTFLPSIMLIVPEVRKRTHNRTPAK